MASSVFIEHNEIEGNVQQNILNDKAFNSPININIRQNQNLKHLLQKLNETIHEKLSNDESETLETTIRKLDTASNHINAGVRQWLKKFGVSLDGNQDGAPCADLRIVAELVKVCDTDGTAVITPRQESVTFLFLASMAGHEETVNYLINTGADVNFKTVDGWTSLHAASHNGFVGIVESLIAAGADLNCTVDSKGGTPLLFAAVTGKFEVAQRLIAAGADLEKPLTDGSTPLQVAAQFGHQKIVDLLLQNRANIFPPQQQPPLVLAVVNGHLGALKSLIQAGAWGNFSSSNHPLHLATWMGHKHIIEFLLDNGDDINQQIECQFTPLHYAILREDGEVVKLLLHRGADMTLRSANGFPPIQLAVIKGELGLLQLLVSKGCSIDLKDAQGLTPLGMACYTNKLPIVQWLVSAGADTNARIPSGETVLHLAAEKGSFPMTKCLLDHGASVSGVTLAGYSALHYAAKSGNREVVALLISRGADVLAVARDGSLPLTCARRENHQDVIRLLTMGN